MSGTDSRTALAVGDAATRRVLLVDDEPDVARGLARLLERAGFEVVAVTAVVDALRAIDQREFDTVVSDINMPGQNGIELLRNIRRKDLDLPVLLITGAPSLETAVRAVDLGAMKYLSKPIDPDELVATVRRSTQLCRLARAKRAALSLLGNPAGEASGRAGLEASFERALASLWMAFQPIVRARDGSIFGYEALLRCDEPSLPHPGAMLDAAERLDALPRLTDTIRARVAAHAADADPGWSLFMNLHPADLLDAGRIARDPHFRGIAPRMVVEITERAALESVGDVGPRISELREAGCRIAIDDLGAGYAGLTSFIQLEPDVVKLDMALVRDVHLRPVKRRLIRSVVDLCHEMEMLVVAEGIESNDEREVLVELGCDLLQGFLLGRPAPPFAVPTW